MRPNSGENGLLGDARPNKSFMRRPIGVLTSFSATPTLSITQPTTFTTTCQTNPINPCIMCLSTMYHPKNLGLPITLICKVITPTRTRSLRALIDPGSQITAMKKNIAEELGLKAQTKPCNLVLVEPKKLRSKAKSP